MQYTDRYTSSHQTVAWPIRSRSRLTTGPSPTPTVPRRASCCSRCRAVSRATARPASGSRWPTVPPSRRRRRRSRRDGRAPAMLLPCGRRCRSSACRSRSRTTSTSPACRPPPPARPSRYLATAARRPPSQRLIAAGAVCVGKTNLDQFATGLVGTRSPYGRPSSTFAPERISGGSSSGSAVAVARGDVPFALGTDTAGSGRVPAAFNNIVGLKPTPGRVSTRGVVPACRSIDCVSVLRADRRRRRARAEPDRRARRRRPVQRLRARTGALRPVAAHRRAVAGDLSRRRRLRLGIRAGGRARAAGSATASSRSTSRRLHAVAALLYAGPWVAERHAVVETLLERDPEAIDPAVRAVVGAARSISATDAFRGLYALREAQRDTRAIWDEVDLLMVPTAPAHPRHAEVDADPLARQRASSARTPTSSTCSAGARSRCRPACTTAGLPFGVTFIGLAGAAMQRSPSSAGAGKRAWRCRSARRHEQRVACRRRRPPDSARERTDGRDRRRRRAPERACRSTASCSSAAPMAARRRAPHRTTACTRCPTRRRPSPACCASPRAARRSRSRSGTMPSAQVGAFLALDRRAARPRQRRARRRPPGAWLRLRSACARRRRRHHAARRLARLSREPSASAETPPDR